MDLSYSAEHEDFRNEVRRFLAVTWKPGMNTDPALKRAFRQSAIGAGYLYRNVPKKYGGSEQEPDIIRAQIIAEEFKRAGAPRETGGIGVSLLTPTLLAAGAEHQKAFFIPKTLTGEYHWAQGYSEPGAGSDLASLKTSAVLRDGQWRINGTKIWTTLAHKAKFMFALVRTDKEAPKHAGISYLLIDLHQPGIAIRPFKTLPGELNFCEVSFDDAVTPADWIVGEPGRGWEVSRTTLSTERNSSVFGATAVIDLFDKLLEVARRTCIEGEPAITNPVIRDRLSSLAGRVEALRYSAYRNLSYVSHGQPDPTFGLVQKLYGSTLIQDLAKAIGDVGGDELLRAPNYGPGKVSLDYMKSLSSVIAGGTSNIQRNIIAERALSLPRSDG